MKVAHYWDRGVKIRPAG